VEISDETYHSDDKHAEEAFNFLQPVQTGHKKPPFSATGKGRFFKKV